MPSADVSKIVNARESPEQSKQIEDLATLSIAKRDARCLVKILISPEFEQQYTTNLLKTLDTVSGSSSGTTLAKVRAAQNGSLESILSTESSQSCLFRSSKTVKITVTCKCNTQECDKTHMWSWQSSRFAGCVLGLYVKKEDNLEGWVEKLLNHEASHLCHNSTCIDLFHVVPEPTSTNKNRSADCITNGVCSKKHFPFCRLDLYIPPEPKQDDPKPIKPLVKDITKSSAVAETPEEKLRIDRLDALYQGMHGRKESRCFIKYITSNNFQVYYREYFLAKLDSYLGGRGKMKAKLEARKISIGDLIKSGSTERVKMDAVDSIRPNGCLVQYAPELGDEYDYANISVTKCGDCDKGHRWKMQRGILIACVLEICCSKDDLDRWVGIMLTESASHLCHNSPCSDPFHVVKEPLHVNIGRNDCVKDGECSGDHTPDCRLDLHWDSHSEWQAVKAECDEECVERPELRFGCSAGCWDKSGKSMAFNSARHWGNLGGTGCKRGGRMMAA